MELKIAKNISDVRRRHRRNFGETRYLYFAIFYLSSLSISLFLGIWRPATDKTKSSLRKYYFQSFLEISKYKFGREKIEDFLSIVKTWSSYAFWNNFLTNFLKKTKHIEEFTWQTKRSPRFFNDRRGSTLLCFQWRVLRLRGAITRLSCLLAGRTMKPIVHLVSPGKRVVERVLSRATCSRYHAAPLRLSSLARAYVSDDPRLTCHGSVHAVFASSSKYLVYLRKLVRRTRCWKRG